MEIGLLYQYDAKKFEKEIKENKKVELGLPVIGLFNWINFLEVTEQKPEQIVAQIKKACMETMGLIEVKGDEDGKGK